MSSARFKIRNQTTDGAWSLFADEGFDCAPSDVLELKLEDTPALDVYLTIFSLIDRSTGRSVVVFAPTSGQAATPTSIVTCTMPAQRGSWQLQCQVNGGIDELDASGRPDSTVNTKSRIVAIRTAVLDLRHPLAVELTVAEPYDSARVAGTLQEAIDGVEAGAAGGGSSGPRFECYFALSDSATYVSLSDDSDGPLDVPLGPGRRNVAIDVAAGSAFTNFDIDGLDLNGDAQTETITGPGGGGGIVQGTKLYVTATATANPAPGGDGSKAAKFYGGDRLGVAAAPVVAFDKLTVDGVITTPSSVNLTGGWITTPAPIGSTTFYGLSYRT